MTLMNDTELGLAGRMKAARLLRGLEQQDVADALGVARTTVSAWERGVSEPSATNFARWAVVTGQPMEWLAGEAVRPKGLEPLTF